MKKFVSILFIVISFNSYGQNTFVPDAIYGVNEITFYGYDFSHFKLAEGKRLNDDIVSYVYSWIGYMKEEMNEKKLSRSLKKDKIAFNFHPTIELTKDLNSRDLVSPIEHSIPSDSIQGIINRYKLDEKEGIGFVVVVECFIKINETSSGYFVFFDIESKEVIASERISDKKTSGRGYGMTNYWGTAMKSLFDKYLKSYRENYFRVYGY